MATVAMSGDDTIVLNNRTFADFGDGDVVNLTFPNDRVNVKTGKNGNSIYGLNESGRQCDVKVRVLRGSPDDKFLNNLYNLQTNAFASFVLIPAQFVKKIGDGNGNLITDTYVLSGGIFAKPPEAKSNVDGETDQSIAEWSLKFTNAPRVIG